MFAWFALGVFAFAPLALHAGVTSQFDEINRRWTLANGAVEATFRLTPSGVFEFEQLNDLAAGTSWKKAANFTSTPIRFEIDGEAWDETTSYVLAAQRVERIPRGGFRQTIILGESRGRGQVIVELELYEGQPILRYGVRFRNTTERIVAVTGADLLSWEFEAGSQRLRALRVEQWLPAASNPADFERQIVELDSSTGEPMTMDTGAHGYYCAWLAVADNNRRGWVAGLEFNGRTKLSLAHQGAERRLHAEGVMDGVHHEVGPGQEFQVPRAFIGPFQGDWDEAGFQTQRFVEQALAKKMPGDTAFPYVSWDSWAYGTDLDEDTLRRNAAIAARLGVELFVVDLGWSRQIGDWYEDKRKFPSGLAAFSNYVHSLGMKFGLHYAWAESNHKSPILEMHTDWRSSGSYGYYGAESLCLSHRPVRDWVIEETVRMIDDYNVDWILQDGENMVKECTKSTHTHHPADSNYSNAVDGLDYVLKEVQKRRPAVAWENCENGGNLMTFQMVQQYVTSIVNDASGARGSRQAAYGATFPFSPRYTDRYMPEERMNSYVTRSYMFGGPWILMNRLAAMGAADLDYLGQEIARFKQMRKPIAGGKVLHLTNPPAEGSIDAIASYNPAGDTGLVFVTRDGGAEDSTLVRMKEFSEEKSYRVSFAEDARTLTLTGAQLRDDGIAVRLPQAMMAEIVSIAPLR